MVEYTSQRKFKNHSGERNMEGYITETNLE